MDIESPGPALFTSTPVKNGSTTSREETSSSPWPCKRQRLIDGCVLFDDSFSSCASPEKSPMIVRLLDESRNSESEIETENPKSPKMRKLVVDLLDESRSSESEIETTSLRQEQCVNLLDDTESSIDLSSDQFNPTNILLDDSNNDDSRASSLDVTIQPIPADTRIMQRQSESQEKLSGELF